MDTITKTERLGPIHLAPGIRRSHVGINLFAVFISGSIFAAVSLMQGYVLEVHLNVPRGEQGSVAGDLSSWAEFAGLILIYPFGILSDRFGRRAIFVFGIATMGIAYALFPFASSVGELLVYRVLYGIGLAAATAMLTILSIDYAQDKSRGKYIVVTKIVAGLGGVLIAGGLARIPYLLTERGMDPVSAGKVMFLAMSFVCIVTAIICQYGLKGGTPVKSEEGKDFGRLMTSGFRAAANPRVALSYLVAVCERSGTMVKVLFLTLWAIHVGSKQDISPAEAMAQIGTILVIMQLASLLWYPVFGVIVDRINRVTAMIIALAMASVGFLSMGFITSPLDFAMVPFFIFLSLGSTSMLLASTVLLGQEAPENERGSIFTMYGMIGAAGIMVLSYYGGYAFDIWGPWAPFVIVGVIQGVTLIVALIVRIVAPGGERSITSTAASRSIIEGTDSRK